MHTVRICPLRERESGTHRKRKPKFSLPTTARRESVHLFQEGCGERRREGGGGREREADTDTLAVLARSA